MATFGDSGSYQGGLGGEILLMVIVINLYLSIFAPGFPVVYCVGGGTEDREVVISNPACSSNRNPRQW